MSTNCYIGIAEKENIKYIYCHNDGYLSYVGVILYLFYKDSDKVKALIKLGDLSSMGANLEPPREIKSEDEFHRMHSILSRSARTSFVLSYKRDRHEHNLQDYHICKSKEYVTGQGQFFYLYKNGKWFVCSNDNMYLLKDVLTNEHVFNKFNQEFACYESFKDITEMLTDMKNSSREKDTAAYNGIFKHYGFNNIELDTCEINGHKGYCAYEVRVDKRRKGLYKNECIYDVIEYIMKKCNLKWI